MKKIIFSVVMSFIVSLIFFAAYLHDKEVRSLILGLIWLWVAGINLFNMIKIK